MGGSSESVADKLKSTRGVANVSSRQWDAEDYKLKALEREDRERSRGVNKRQREGEGAGAGPGGEAAVQMREGELDFGLGVGAVKMVNLEGDGAQARAGYFCKTCELSFADSNTYVEHVNSVRHMSKLGLSMEVQRSSVRAVKARLRLRIEEKQAKFSVGVGKAPKAYDFVEKVQALEALEETAEAERQAEKQARKDERKRKRQEAKAKAKENANGGPADEEMMKLMGFGGFGSSKAGA